MKLKLKVADLIVVAVLIACVTAILFPVFQKTDHRPVGFVLDGVNKPIPHAVLRFRDGQGHLVTTLTADADGIFNLPNLYEHNKDMTVDGFGLTRISYNTGSPIHFYFSPLGSQTAVVHDTQGRPIANVDVIFRPMGPTRFVRPEEPDVLALSGQDGVTQISAPIGARYALDCWNPRWAMSQVQTFPTPKAVRYEVTVVPAATIAGHLMGSNGKPLVYYTVLADRIPWSSGSGQTSPTTVNSHGRFRLAGLRPGTYELAATSSSSQVHGPEDFFARKFTVSSGQTIDVSLWYDEGNGAKAAMLNQNKP